MSSKDGLVKRPRPGTQSVMISSPMHFEVAQPATPPNHPHSVQGLDLRSRSPVSTPAGIDSRSVAMLTSQQIVQEPYLLSDVKEIYETRYNSKRRKKERAQDLVTFPADNLVVETIPKVLRTKPDLQYQPPLEPFVETAFSTFAAPWKRVKANYTHFQKAKEVSNVLSKPLPGYEDTISKEKQGSKASLTVIKPAEQLSSVKANYYRSTLAPNDLHFKLMTPHNSHTNKENSAERNKGRLPLFWYFEPDYDWEPGTAISMCYRAENYENPNDLLTQTKNGFFEFVVEVKKLSFSLGDLEPFYCSLALYDVNNKRKISENFYFDENVERIKELLPNYETTASNKKAIFSISKSNISDGIYLVLLIERVFGGENEAAIDSYAKATSSGNKKDKEKNKAAEKISSEYKKLGEASNVQSRVLRFRQLFGWACLPVFDSSTPGGLGTPTSGMGTLTHTSGQAIQAAVSGGSSIQSDQPAFLLHNNSAFKNIYPLSPKDNICDLILDLKDKGAKRKDLSGCCSINVTTPPDDIVRIDPSFDLVLNPNSSSADAPQIGAATREIQEVWSPSPTTSPSWSYMNNLYVYPLYLNFNSHERKFQNIAVKMELRATDDPAVPPLKAIYAPTTNEFKTEALTHISYHNKSPSFQNEFKIKLPVTLTPKHHLLFTFYHLVATLKKKKKGKDEQELEFVCGYSVLPLYAEGKFVVHNNANYHALPVFFINGGKLEPGYLSLHNDENKAKTVHFLDSGKPVFQVSFSLFSTVYTQDPHLAEVYRLADSNDLDKALPSLKKTNENVVVANFPIIMNLILGIVAKKTKFGLAAAQSLTKLLIAIKKPNETRSSLLETYVSQIYDLDDNSKTNVSLLSSLPLYLWMMYRSLKPINEKKEAEDLDLTDVGPVSWFFFDIIVKSLALFLDANRASSPESSRATRFEPSDAGMQDPRSALNKLTTILAESIKKALLTAGIAPVNAMAGLAAESSVRELNKSCALFIRDLMTHIDRGQAIRMVQSHLKELAELGNDIVAVNLKFDFIRIIADYEHYVPMNLPIKFKLDKLPDVSSFTLSKKYFEDHTLVTIIIEEVMKTYRSEGNKAIRNIATGALYDIIIKHEFDERYQDPDKRHRVASLYFLLLIKIIDNIEKKESAVDFTTNPKTYTDELEQKVQEDNQFVAKLVEKREFLICVLYILQASDRSFVRSWWKREVSSRLIIFLHLLAGIITAFEYLPGKNLQRRRIIMNIDAAQVKKTKKTITEEQSKQLHQLLSSEVSVLVLDILEDFITDYQKELVMEPISEVMETIFYVFIHMMKRNQSEQFIHHLYASLRSFVIKFPNHFFITNTSYCESIAYQIFRHCCSTIPNIRIQASTLFYLLLKHNHRVVGNFGRMRIQSITALSRLVAAGKLHNDALLRESLGRIQNYALHEYSVFLDENSNSNERDLSSLYARTSFARGVQDLCFTLSKILQDTIQVNELKEKADKETIAELYYRIAHGYQHTPDLRVQWLRSLAEYHSKIENYAEAAVATIHVVALIADFLITSKKINYIQAHIFKSICPTIAEFAGDEEGTCQSDMFSEEGLLSQLKLAIKYLEEAEMYETAADLFKVAIPIYERSNAYKDLSEAHSSLDRLWKKVYSTNESRLFGTYFRVGFYGKKFEKQDGKEYVYKTPKLTHLFAFSDSLKTFHQQLFGEGNVIVLQDSNPPDRQKLLPDKVYLQITFVEPYFSTLDTSTATAAPTGSLSSTGSTLSNHTPAVAAEEPRNTHFERNNKISQFMFETPFAKGGKAHSENITEQYKRKTIITVANPFPYMLTRLQVTGKQEIISSPIQNAIDNLHGQLNKLRIEVNRLPKPDKKTLQQVLQGSAIPQVNPGIRLICEGFLGNQEVLNSYPSPLILQLCYKLKEFLQGCADGLQAHKRLIEDEAGQAFHREVENGYKQLQDLVSGYLSKVPNFKDQDSDATDTSVDNEDDE